MTANRISFSLFVYSMICCLRQPDRGTSRCLTPFRREFSLERLEAPGRRACPSARGELTVKDVELRVDPLGCIQGVFQCLRVDLSRFEPSSTRLDSVIRERAVSTSPSSANEAAVKRMFHSFIIFLNLVVSMIPLLTLCRTLNFSVL